MRSHIHIKTADNLSYQMSEGIINNLMELYARCEQDVNESDKVEANKSLSHFIDIASVQLKKVSSSIANQNQLKTKLALALNNRGLLKYYTVDFEMAVQDFTAAISYNNKLAQAYYNRGLIYYRLGNFNEAITDLNSALSLDPGFLSAHQCLESTLAQRDKRSAVSSNSPSIIV